MRNKNKNYLESIDSSKKGQILRAIAAHYGCTTKEIERGITDASAEPLYEYIGNNPALRESVYLDLHPKDSEE